MEKLWLVNSSNEGPIALYSARLDPKLDAEARLNEVWLGRNLYSDFLRRNGRRPDPHEAATIGLLMGTRVKDCDSKLQPDIAINSKKRISPLVREAPVSNVIRIRECGGKRLVKA